MTQALGQLPNAPLVYVLAQIAYSRVPNIDKKWEDFHEAIFADYPDSKEAIIREFKLENMESAAVRRWEFHSKSGRHGIILSPDSLVFHTTDYTDFEAFLSQLENVATAFGQVMPETLIHRLGLRYIDLIMPREGESINDYLVPEYHAFSGEPLGCESIHHETVDQFKTGENSKMTFRSRQTSITQVLPRDLFPNMLTQCELASTERPPETRVGSLDFDHFLTLSESYSAELIKEKFNDLHENLSDAFKSVTNDHAQSIWSESHVTT